LTGGILKWLSD